MFMVLDVETTFKEVNGKTDPSPFVEGNKLVSIGLQKFRTDSFLTRVVTRVKNLTK